MQPYRSHRALYAAFDRFPSAKGAAIHIDRFARTLFEVMDGGLLYVLGDATLPTYQREGRVEIFRYAGAIPNFLKRTLGYGRRLSELLEALGDSLQLCHFRDPWSGVPILTRPSRRCRTVYEINGLPSIELPYAYPRIPPATLEKIRALERLCWSEADWVLTPAQTMKQNLVALGVSESKIVVVPNGADLIGSQPRPPEAPARYLIYIGAVQRWQGVDVLLNAFAQLADFEDLRLVLCASSPRKRTKPYRTLARRLKIADRLVWLYRLDRETLAPWLAHATLSVAPLTACSRNLAQGCCPLKILESMAAGVPVVASDLPAVREIMADGVHGRLVRPDRPAELARAIRVLLEYPERAREMGEQARQHVERHFTWERSTKRLAAWYRFLLEGGERSERDER